MPQGEPISHAEMIAAVKHAADFLANPWGEDTVWPSHDEVATLRAVLAHLERTQPQAQVLHPHAGTVWRHKKRASTYTVLGVADVQVTDSILEGHRVVVYRADDGKLWVRPTEEFYDGRFEQMPLPPSPETPR